MTKDSSYWIHHLQLQPHPDGGHYRQTYRSDVLLPKNLCRSVFRAPAPHRQQSISCLQAWISLRSTACNPMNSGTSIWEELWWYM